MKHWLGQFKDAATSRSGDWPPPPCSTTIQLQLHYTTSSTQTSTSLTTQNTETSPTPPTSLTPTSTTLQLIFSYHPNSRCIICSTLKWITTTMMFTMHHICFLSSLNWTHVKILLCIPNGPHHVTPNHCVAPGTIFAALLIIPLTHKSHSHCSPSSLLIPSITLLLIVSPILPLSPHQTSSQNIIVGGGRTHSLLPPPNIVPTNFASFNFILFQPIGLRSTPNPLSISSSVSKNQDPSQEEHLSHSS